MLSESMASEIASFWATDGSPVNARAIARNTVFISMFRFDNFLFYFYMMYIYIESRNFIILYLPKTQCKPYRQLSSSSALCLAF